MSYCLFFSYATSDLGAVKKRKREVFDHLVVRLTQL